MRGYPQRHALARRAGGSIPADAGLPWRGAPTSCRCRVYPRGCGATCGVATDSRMMRGLSPRMRGYRRSTSGPAFRSRSIPADAGLPRPRRRRRQGNKVYPRGCGATQHYSRRRESIRGLSPRMRGYQAVREALPSSRGSIPADAGLPKVNLFNEGATGVYPRGCGATQSRALATCKHEGLSPRMRGYPHDADLPQRVNGSIPADAGLPPTPLRNPASKKVYPRGCGATKSQQTGRETRRGLSPRMRGYQIPTDGQGNATRSIPADAGLPCLSSQASRSWKVYPRGCGATKSQQTGRETRRGLSPRMRGYPSPSRQSKP